MQFNIYGIFHYFYATNLLQNFYVIFLNILYTCMIGFIVRKTRIQVPRFLMTPVSFQTISITSNERPSQFGRLIIDAYLWKRGSYVSLKALEKPFQIFKQNILFKYILKTM